MPSEAALQRVGLAWTTPETEMKTMDTALAIAFADIVDGIWAGVAKPNLEYATTGELIDEIKAHVAVDGKLHYRTIDG